jgi:hypothetical protein
MLISMTTKMASCQTSCKGKGAARATFLKEEAQQLEQEPAQE